MARLSDALEPLAGGPDQLEIDAPEAWSQGRTLFGGMTAALCHEAARRRMDAPTPLRSAQFLFCGPATGRLRLRSQILREGRSTRVIAIDCLSESGPAARAAFAFGGRRETRIDFADAAAPAVPPPENCPVFLERTGGFHDNFEMRLAAGSPLLSGGPACFTVWVRFRDPPGADPATALLALADALPPAAMALFPAPAPISTLTWAIDIADMPADVDGWHLLRSAGEQARDGYAIQAMDLWDANGTLVASGRQSVAIFV